MNIEACYPDSEGATELRRAQVASARALERHDEWIVQHEECAEKTEAIVGELRDSHIAERAESRRTAQAWALAIVVTQAATQLAIRLLGG